ncbi:hypothetical protein ACFX13_038667 [Malus domestica]
MFLTFVWRQLQNQKHQGQACLQLISTGEFAVQSDQRATTLQSSNQLQHHRLQIAKRLQRTWKPCCFDCCRQGGTSKYFGLATGTPKGGVPNSRISVYKVCWASGCASADILAAFDDAIPDGVDIISTSLGSVFPLYYLEEPIAIGSFPTMKTRTVDRKFVAKAVLGNGEIYNDVMQGNSVNNFDLHGKSFPLIYEGDAANFFAGANSAISTYCTNGVMNSHKLKGRLFSAKPSRLVLASW